MKQKKRGGPRIPQPHTPYSGSPSHTYQVDENPDSSWKERIQSLLVENPISHRSDDWEVPSNIDIPNEIKYFSSEQNALLSWLCAVRMLPLIIAIPTSRKKSGFLYWKKTDLQGFLYALLAAIDKLASWLGNTAIYYDYDDVTLQLSSHNIKPYSFHPGRITTTSSPTTTTTAPTTKTTTARTFIPSGLQIHSTRDLPGEYANVVFKNYTYFRTPYSCRSAGDTLKRSKRKDNGTQAALRLIAFLIEATDRPNTRTASLALMALRDAAQICSLDFEAIIANDISYVKSTAPIIGEDIDHLDMKSALDGSTAIYAGLWDNFISALRADDCDYWARLYEGIFLDNFVLDQSALQQRQDVPPEVSELGAASVGHWLEKLEYGTEVLNEARVIILGDKGSGKTSLAWRIVDPAHKMPADDQSTDGVDVSIWQPEDSDVKVHIWDFAGHSITHAAHRFFMSERCVYIIVYDGRLDSGSKSLEYWFDNVDTYGGNSPIFVVINEKDVHIDSVQENTLKDKYGKYRILEFVRFSIKNNRDALERFRGQLFDQITVDMTLDKAKVPLEVFKIKVKLEQQFGGGNQIHMENYLRIAQPLTRQRSKKEAREALSFLSALGVCLWYPKIERFQKLVLKPKWITHGVYRIINWLKESKRHVLYDYTFDDIFTAEQDQEYLQDRFFLWDLLKEYQLAYESDNCLEVPIAMPHDAPRRGMADNFPVRDSLYMYYSSESDLPTDTITRFIVRHHDSILEGDVWRYGVRLQMRDCEALVFEGNRKIEVLVKGTHRTEVLTSLRTTLDEIFMTYKREAPNHMYRVIDENNGEFEILEEEVILRYFKAQQDYLGRYGGLSMASAVSNYNIENHGVMQIGNRNIATTYEQTNNYPQINADLQPLLNALLREIKGNSALEAEAPLLKSAIEALEETEEADVAKAKKKGVGETLKKVVPFIGKIAKEGVELAVKALPLVKMILESMGSNG